MIIIQIYDNDTSFTVYEIPQKVTVLPEFSLLEEIMNKLELFNPINGRISEIND